MRQEIYDVVTNIVAFDAIEQKHIDDVLDWIGSGTQLFRISKPDNPPKHLVSYFVLYDKAANKLLLIDHINSGLRLPAGGHIDPGEHPKSTVIREAKEELDINANFETKFGDKPLFVTITKTIGQGTHTDVSLWFVINGDINQKLNFEKREMNGYGWYTPEEILKTNINKLDPQMHRFTKKFINN